MRLFSLKEKNCEGFDFHLKLLYDAPMSIEIALNNDELSNKLSLHVSSSSDTKIIRSFVDTVLMSFDEKETKST